MLELTAASKWYQADDPVHGFDHVRRVLALALSLARSTGADEEIVQAAVLLHDAAAASPVDLQARGVHEKHSAALAAEVLAGEGWPADRIAAVVHCIQSHRYRSQQPPQSLEAQIVFDADKLDVIGAFGIARTLAYAQQAGQPAYAPVSERFRQNGELEPEEAHSAYHEYLLKLRHVRSRLNTDQAKALAEQREPLLHAFFKQLAQEAAFPD